MAAAEKGSPVLLDAINGAVVATLPRVGELDVTCCAFNADGTRLAVGWSEPHEGPGLIKLFEVATRRELLTLSGHSAGVMCVAFSPDGRRLASGSWDRTVKLWDTARGEEVFTFRGHTQGVLRVAFSPDGNLLASGGIDFTVRIWDARPLD